MAESARTVVLVGRTGNGKSATGNSIIGADVFDSFPSSAGVTATCQLHKTVLDNHHILNVIDTPGLFDTSVEPGIIRKEIAKCINMAKNGIHAFLVVLSVTTRFSQEEALAIEMLKQFFGGKIFDYMILVFTHGNALGEMSLADYLGRYCPEPLVKVLEMCGNRYVLFDNMTKDELKKSQQQMELLRLVDAVVVNNGGVAYSNELFVDSPDICENGVKFNKAYEKLLLDKIESKLGETTARMEKQLADGQAARKQAEAMTLEAQLKSIAEMSKLSEQLEISRKEAESQRKSQIESEKKFKEEQERLAQREMKMLTKSRRDSQQKLEESKEKFSVEQRRLQAESSEISEKGPKFTKAYEDQLLEMESKHREMTLRLEKQLEVELIARMQAEAAQMKSNEEISKVREDLKRAQREARELHETHRDTKELLKKMIQEKDEENQKKTNNCAISEITSAIEHKIESKLRETSLRLENQLADKFARMQSEDKAVEAQRKSNDEIRKLREDMEKARRHTEDTFTKIQLRLDEENQKKNSCTGSEITSAIEHQIESKLRETTLKFENQLANKFAQMQAEFKAQEALRKSNDEMKTLREDMERTQRYTENAFKKIQLRMDEENQEKINSSVSEITSTMEHQFESNIRERIVRFGEQLADEKVARLLAEDRTQEVQKKSNDEICKLRERTVWLEKHLINEQANRMKSEDEISKLSEDLERAEKDGEELQNNRLTDSEISKDAYCQGRRSAWRMRRAKVSMQLLRLGNFEEGH